MLNIQDNSHWVKAYHDAKAQMDFHQNESEKIKNALPFLKEKAFKNANSEEPKTISLDLTEKLLISKEEVEKYNNKTNFIMLSKGRIALFAEKAKELNGLHYRDFVNTVNQYGDPVKERSFYVTLARLANEYGLVNDKGVFKVKNTN